MNSVPDSTSTHRAEDLLSGLLSDPQALNRIASLIRSATEGASSGEEASLEKFDLAHSDLPVQDSTPAARVVSTDGLAAMLSDPAMLEKLPQMIAVIKPLLGSLSASAPPKENVPAHDPATCRNNLLLALKPFLSPHRRDAIDTMLRISHLGNVFSQLK